jgi:hypothetical protein
MSPFNIRLSLFLISIIYFSSCSGIYKPIPIYKRHQVKQKKYDKNELIYFRNFQFHFYDDVNLTAEEKAKRPWLNNDTVCNKFTAALQKLPIRNNIVFAGPHRNLNYISNSTLYNPRKEDQKEIIKLANSKNNEIVLLPLVCYYKYRSDKQYYDIQMRDPSTEYYYVTYLHVYLIRNEEIIYRQIRKYKGFTLWKEDIGFSQKMWDKIVNSAMKPYYERLK